MVAKLWAQSKSETDIARELHCNVNTICRDIKFLKKLSQQFVFDMAFAIEQAISTFFELTKDNEIIYEVDFENDRIHEIHTKYNGEPQSWGWHENVNELLSKVKPISNIAIRDVQDIYDILTDREKLECFLQEYVK